jgi:hypothetical protein
MRLSSATIKDVKKTITPASAITLLGLVGYEALCWGAAGVIMLSVPFALAIKVDQPHLVESQAL